MQPTSSEPVDGPRIESWKEIAAFFGRDERTVKRWEKTRNLPIHRLPGDKGGVFAYTSELTLWLNSAGKEKPLAQDAVAATPTSREPLPDRDTASGRVAPVIAAAVSNRPFWRERKTLLFWSIPFVSIAIFALLSLLDFAKSTRGGAAVETVNTAVRNIRPPAAGAQEAYLKGRYYWNHRTDGSLRQAVEAFTQAVVHDSQYAPAYAGLADSYDLMPQYTSMPKSEAFPLAISAAKKAVALDDSLSEAHRALAFGLFYWEWDVNTAFREYQRAIQLDPKDVDAHNWYATSLLLSRNISAAQAEITKANELDPASRAILANQALISYWAGDHQASIAKLNELESAEPDFLAPPQYLADIFLMEKNFPAYVAEIKHLAVISKSPQDAALANAAETGFAKAGAQGMLQQMRAVYLGAYQHGQSSGFELAHICALLDRKPDADRYLQAAIDAHDFLAMTVFDGDFEAHMNGDPGFERLKQQIKLRMNRSEQASSQ